MNKKGSLGIAIISTIFVFIIGLTCINFITGEVTNARDDLNCSDAASISDGTKLLCLVVDTQVPYWILIIVSLAIGGIIARMTL